MSNIDDPFAGGQKLPSVSFKDMPVGTSYTLLVTAPPKVVQARDFDTDEPAYWPAAPGQTPNPKMTVVTEVTDTATGEAKSLWAAMPSSLFAAIGEAQRVAGAKIEVGGTLIVQHYDSKANDNPKKAAQKLYRAAYTPPVVDAFAQAAAAAPAAAPAPVDFPPPAAPAAPVVPPLLPQGQAAIPAQPAAPAAPAPAAVPAPPWAQ